MQDSNFKLVVMKKRLLFCILFFIGYLLSYAQCSGNNCVSRGLLAGLIYEQVYDENNPDNYQPMASYPSAYIDNTGNVELDKKISLVSYLDYGDGVRVLGHMDSGGYLLTQGSVSRGEAVVAILEAWNVSPDYTGNVSYNDIDSNHEYYGYINEAEDLGLLDNVFTGSNFYSDLSLTQNELIGLIVNITHTNYHPVSNSKLLNENNYFTPNNYQPKTLGFSRGLEQGVFNHYAKNSFSIPDIKFNLNFSHYYSTQMVELPQSYFPVLPLGRGWTHTYNAYIVREDNVGVDETDYYYIKWADGNIDIYNEDDNKYVTLGVYDDLDELSGDRIRITKKDQTRYYFEQLDNDEPIYYLYRIRDSNGNEINIEYETSDVDNDFERIKNVESPSGKKLHFYYHNNTDFIDYIQDPIRRQIRFTYNEERLKYFYDAKNQKTKYYYVSNDEDAADGHQYKRFLLRRVKLPKGNSIRAEYDDDDNGKLESYRINDTETRIDVDYSDYESIRSTVEVPMPDGSMQDHDYEFDINGMTTHFQNDTQDININYPDPTDDNPLLPTNVDANGLDIDYEYDDNGNVTSIQVENNEDENFWYDNNNNLTHYRDENGNDTYFNYDDNNNLTSVQDALGNFINLNYDSFGQVLSVTNQEGITVNYTYEDDGVVSTVSAPENLTSSFSYDGVNRLLSQTINGQTSSFIYDPNDNLTSQTNIGGLTTTFNYDQNDNLITITNANGVNTSFEYNEEDQVISETFGSLVKQYQYNDNGSLDKYIKPSGVEINYDYTSDGQLNEAGTITDVDYYGSNGGKKEGLVSSIASADIRYNFDYNTLNRLDEVKIEGEPDLTVAYQYDNVGNITKITYPEVDMDFEVLYSYDVKNRMQAVRINKNGDINTIAEYSYRDDDLLEQVNYGNNTYSIFLYDNAGRKVGVEHYKEANPPIKIFSEHIDLDNRGNITSENRYYNETEQQNNFFYAEAKTHTYNQNNHITSENGESITVNTDGNTVSKTITSANNNVSTATISYTYNVDDQLTSITPSDSYYGTALEYEYDAYGNRTRKEYANQNIGTDVIWDIINNNPIVEISDFGGSQNRYLVFGATGLEATISPTTSGASDAFYHYGDLRGSVVANNYSTDNFLFTKYDDFGNIVDGQSDDLWENYKYLGKHGITMEGGVANAGIYYVKARYYDAKLGRFLTQDPIWSTNLYPYAENNPISKSDINGEFWNYVVGAAVNVGIGYATAALTGQDYSWKDAGRDAVIGAAGVGVVSGARNLYNTYKSVSKVSKIYSRANSLTNKQVVQQAANVADNTIGGSGRFAGTTKHSYAKTYIDDFQNTFGNRNLSTEYYFNRGRGNIGRLDVKDDLNNIIYDYKFGVSGWRSGQLVKYQRNFSDYIFKIIRPN